jgi:hypothetical protein
MVDPRIPPEAICDVCAKPMRVNRHGGRAAALGLKDSDREFFTIECCGAQLRIEDEDAERALVKLLDEFHAHETPGPPMS